MPADPMVHPSSSPHPPIPGRSTPAVPFPTSSSGPSGLGQALPSGAISPPPSTATQVANAEQPATPPRGLTGAAGSAAGAVGKMKAASAQAQAQGTPKDTIPLSKTPRKQRSSRFHVTEKVELERLPGFLGESNILIELHPASRLTLSCCSSRRGPRRRAPRSLPPETSPMCRRFRFQRCRNRTRRKADQGSNTRRDARLDHDATRCHH